MAGYRGGKSQIRQLSKLLDHALRAKGSIGIKSRAKDFSPRFEHLKDQQKWSQPLPQFQHDFKGYCEYRKVSLTPQQLRVADTVVREHRALVPSGNEVGKSFFASVLASWHYDCWNPGITIVTAPNLKQVQDIIFKELRNLRKGDPNFLRRAPRLYNSSDHFIDGLTANSPDGFQGRHDCSVMLIFDEAEGIAPEFWHAALTMARPFMVAIYNPTTTGSQAAIEERSGHWPIIPLNALEHPNVVTRSLVVPNAVTFESAKSRLIRWSRKISEGEQRETDVLFDGVWYRPGPAAEARVLGRRPTLSVDTVFSAEIWRKINETKYDIEEKWPIQIGVDVARFGDDYTCIHARKGFSSLSHDSFNGYDTIATARYIDKLCWDINRDNQFNTTICVDETGVGGGVIDQLRLMGYNPTPVNSGAKSNYPSEYPNIRSELVFALAEVCDKYLVDLSRLDSSVKEDIRKQSEACKYKLDTRGRRVIEEKAIVKARINRSPDDLDALALAYYSPMSCLEKYT